MRLLVVVLLFAFGTVALPACGSGDDGSPAAPAGEEQPTPSAHTAKQWPAKWCQAEPGMTRDELRELMGEPTEEYTADNTPEGFDPQMIWEAFEYHFTAFFNADDVARQLDANTIDMTEEQVAALKCEETRTL